MVHTCDPVKATLASNKTKGENGARGGAGSLVFQKCSPSFSDGIVGERSDSCYPSQKPLSVPSAHPGSSGHPCHRGLSACVPGDLISRLTSDTTMVSDLVSQNINIFLRNTVKVTGVVVFMFSLSWQLSLVTFMGFPIIMMVSNIYGKYYKVGGSTCVCAHSLSPLGHWVFPERLLCPALGSREAGCR